MTPSSIALLIAMILESAASFASKKATVPYVGHQPQGREIGDRLCFR